MAKRINLREFQEDVAARMKAGATAGASRLGVQAGRDLWLVDLTEAGEVVPVPKLAPVPLTRSWLRGLVNVRGNLYSVLDFSEFLGGEATPLASESRILLLHPRFLVNCALLVNRTLGLKKPETLARRDEAGAPSLPAKAEYADGDGRLWKELDMRALIRHPDFFQVGI